MDIKGAIFDCDGTLVDSLSFWEVFYTKIGDTYFGGKKFLPEAADDKAMRTQPVGFLGKLLHEKYGVAESTQALIDWCIELFIWYYSEVVELKAGVRELLSHLKSKGIKMCIASASEKKLIELVLGRHGVLDYFESIVSCTEVGAGKDKPDVFLAAEKFLGTPHEKTWIFEDSLLAIETSKKAGFRVVGVYDACTFGQDMARELSDEYIDEGGSFIELIAKI
jgi:HAD superfamily hydrolase (TIGR01509 family)